MKKINFYKVLKYSAVLICWLFTASALRSQSSFKHKKTYEEDHHQFINIGYEEIRFLQKGEGKDILLIHGTPGSIEDWNEIFDSLAKSFRVTAFDRLGHGFSSKRDYSYDLASNADLAEKLILQLNLNSPLIVGHSYGGSVATYMAVHADTKDREYLIIDSPFYEIKPSGINKLISTPILGKGIAFLSSFTIAKSQIKKGVLPMFKSTEGEKLNNYIQERQKLWSQSKVIYSNSKEITNLQDDLKNLSDNYKNTNSIMTLITVEDTLNTFRKGTEKLHGELKNSELIIIPKTGHYIQLEQPEEIIRIIRERRSSTLQD
ncbi:alpha/beta fold hydrolase [Brumimicrobium oceani]|nr:alpha/beta hydrolase [Brumimicrobium oceani]